MAVGGVSPILIVAVGGISPILFMAVGGVNIIKIIWVVPLFQKRVPTPRVFFSWNSP